jgi:hypothetical protein
VTSASFPFRFDVRFRLAALPFGVSPSTAVVRVTDRELAVRFGPWDLRTDRDNVIAAQVTGPYSWPKVIGPPHLSLADRGLTFATNAEQGVCMHFERPVRGLDPMGVLRHPAVTVTVHDAAALAELLDRSAQSTDARDRTAPAPLDQVVDELHDDLRSLSAAELRRRASALGLPGVSRRTKAELIDLLEPSSEVSRRS